MLILGMFVWPPLTRYLIDEYSWRGATMILGAISLNGVVCAALLRPPPMKMVLKVCFTKKNRYKVKFGSTLPTTIQKKENYLKLFIPGRQQEWH